MEELFAQILWYAMMALTLAYVPLQIFALIRLRGWWRIAALLPIAFVAIVTVLSLMAGTGNLTMIVIVVTCAGGSILLLAILTHGRLERAMLRFATGRR